MSGVLAVTGLMGPRVSFDNITVSKLNFGATATATIRFDNDGKIYDRANAGPFVEIGTWLTPTNAALAANYECRATVLSGSLTSGTTGSWLALSSDRDWTLAKATPGSVVATFTLEIRQAVSGSVMDSATITLEAEYA